MKLSADGRKVVLFQPPNRIGLGHMSRLANIAKQLQSLDSSIQTPFVVEGETHNFLQERGLPAFALPSVSTFQAKAWKSYETADLANMINQMAKAVLDALVPDIVVFDCFPQPEFLEAVVRRGVPFGICIRKVRDFSRYARDRRLSTALERARVLIIPHTSDEFPLPAEFARNAQYVGMITPDLPDDPYPIQLELRSEEKKTIVITGGGGGAAETVSFYNDVLGALDILSTKGYGFKALLLTGHLFREWSALGSLADVKVLVSHPRPLDAFATADLVICQGGYNTLAELGSLGTRVICVPAKRGFDDQFERAKNCSLSENQVIIAESSAPAVMAESIRHALSEPYSKHRSIPSPGALRAAIAIYNLMGCATP